MSDPEVLTADELTNAVNAPLILPDGVQSMLAICAAKVPLIAQHTETAATIQVRNQAEADTANAKLAEIRADIVAVQDSLEAHTQEASRRHKLLTGFRARFVDPFTAAGKTIKVKVIAYDEDQRRKAAEAQRLADEAARKERERQEQAAAALRQKEEDARRAAEQARRDAEAATGAERARLEAEARRKEREAAAAAVKAEVREDAAVQTFAPTIAAPKATARARRDVTVEIVDIVAFVAAAAANPMLCGYIDVPSLAANLKKAKASNSMLTCAGVKFGEKFV